MAKVIEKKAGRPKNELRSVRINSRFPENVAELLRRASELRGVSVASFLVESAKRAAEEVIEAETRWKLDEDETAKLARLLRHPPKVNARARRAQALSADVEIRS